MIDYEYESLLTFAEATKTIPTRPALSQLYRWSERGIRGIKLEFVQLGGRRCTSKQALGRFFTKLTVAAGGSAEPIKSNKPTTKTRRRQIAQAEAELIGAGFEIGGAV